MAADSEKTHPVFSRLRNICPVTQVLSGPHFPLPFGKIPAPAPGQVPTASFGTWSANSASSQEGLGVSSSNRGPSLLLSWGSRRGASL